MKTDIAPGIFTLAGVLTNDECRQHIAACEAEGFTPAPLNVGGLREQIVETERNNARVMRDDLELARDLWQRIKPDIPGFLDGRQAIGLNERLRFYRYEPGQQFRFHQDGSFERANGEKSLLTFMIYLNDGFEGGETRFPGASVTPKTGMALVFRHPLLHEGATVQSGIKYVLRSDVMFGRVGRLYG